VRVADAMQATQHTPNATAALAHVAIALCPLAHVAIALCPLARRTTPGTHFTGFTSTKVQILTPEELRARRASDADRQRSHAFSPAVADGSPPQGPTDPRAHLPHSTALAQPTSRASHVSLPHDACSHQALSVF
jgi:hypothetical protein